ncbi:MAG TPA: hypothetical protein VFU02_14700 [Polyangiaceae bacterium]|nr:hypothetical protein [Polyangiaceae bacterium]
MTQVMQRVLEGDLQAVADLRPFLKTRARRVAGPDVPEATVEDVAQAVLERSVVIMVNGGFRCHDVGHLKGYLIVMLRRAFYAAVRRLEREALTDDMTMIEMAVAPADIRASWTEVVDVVRRVQRRIRATPSQREAFERRLALTVDDRDHGELLVQDGKLDARAAADVTLAAIEADMGLQRRALRALKLGVERAIAAAELDAETGAFVLRFLDMLRERKRESGVDRSSTNVADSGPRRPA